METWTRWFFSPISTLWPYPLWLPHSQMTCLIHFRPLISCFTFYIPNCVLLLVLPALKFPWEFSTFYCILLDATCVQIDTSVPKLISHLPDYICKCAFLVFVWVYHCVFKLNVPEADFFSHLFPTFSFVFHTYWNISVYPIEEARNVFFYLLPFLYSDNCQVILWGKIYDAFLLLPWWNVRFIP